MSTLFTRVFIYDADEKSGMRGPVDVLVDGQRIARIGSLAGETADRTIDGAGRHLLIPGLISLEAPMDHGVRSAR